MNTYRLRRVAAPDAATESALALVTYLDSVCFPLDDRVDPESAWWWIAVDAGGHACAYAGMTHLYSDRVFMSRCGVLPAHRGRGLQRRLLQARESYARRAGFTRALTYTLVASVPSSNNLIRAGYRLYVPEQPIENGLHWFKGLTSATDGSH